MAHLLFSKGVTIESVKPLVICIIIAVIAAIIFYFRTEKIRDGLQSDLHKHVDRPDTAEL